MRGSLATKERDAKIAALRDQGEAPCAIAMRMGVSKNVVAGVLFRAEMVSPRKERTPRKPHAERAAITAANKIKAATRMATKPVIVAPKKALPPAIELRSHRSKPCCWPMWNDRERAPRPPIFCGQASAPDRVYCHQHVAISYVPSRPREIADA